MYNQATAVALNETQEKTILVIDDVPFNHKMYQKVLNPLGCNIVIASNVVEVCIHLNAKVPDTILVNHEMIDGEWRDFSRVVKENPLLRNVPLVAVIRERNEAVMRYVLESGYDHFVVRNDVSKRGYLADTLKRL